MRRKREQENEKETEKEHRQIIKGSNPVADWQLQSQTATGRRNAKITMLANTMHLGATPQQPCKLENESLPGLPL